VVAVTDEDPNVEYVPVARDGYPALLFVEFHRDGSWSAVNLSATGPQYDAAQLDSRARGVLRAYAVDLLARLANADAADRVTIKIPGMLDLDQE
jgi:hypothetical protein